MTMVENGHQLEEEIHEQKHARRAQYDHQDVDILDVAVEVGAVGAIGEVHGGVGAHVLGVVRARVVAGRCDTVYDQQRAQVEQDAKEEVDDQSDDKKHFAIFDFFFRKTNGN